PADQRIAAYRKLLEDYPDSEVSPQAQFMVGFIYSEELKNYDEAETAFKGLLTKYPKAELAPSAQWMIDHMRSEEAPAFINMDSDSLGVPAGRATTTPAEKKPAPKPAARANKNYKP